MRTLTAQQTQVLASRFYNAGVRVLADRGDGTMTDLTTLLGTNWVKTVKFGRRTSTTLAARSPSRFCGRSISTLSLLE